MTFKYFTTCKCCGTTEGVEMRRVASDRELPLCPECADLHKVHSTRAIEVVKGSAKVNSL